VMGITEDCDEGTVSGGETGALARPRGDAGVGYVSLAETDR
jgi:hypothetical protein